MPVFEKGVLRNYLIDTYYAKKLEPTTAGRSNVVFTLGTKPQAEILNDVGEAILVIPPSGAATRTRPPATTRTASRASGSAAASAPRSWPR
jgi:predicted Zn-dependent protease